MGGKGRRGRGISHHHADLAVNASLPTVRSHTAMAATWMTQRNDGASLRGVRYQYRISILSIHFYEVRFILCITQAALMAMVIYYV
jgi:hypothetical protein